MVERLKWLYAEVLQRMRQFLYFFDHFCFDLLLLDKLSTLFLLFAF